MKRELLFKILGKLGFPSKFVSIIKSLYSDVHARLVINGELSKPTEYNSGVKQGCKLSPTPFGIYAAALLLLAFRNTNNVYSINKGSLQV